MGLINEMRELNETVLSERIMFTFDVEIFLNVIPCPSVSLKETTNNFNV